MVAHCVLLPAVASISRCGAAQSPAAPGVFLGGVALGEELLLPEGCIVVKAQLGICCYELAVPRLCQWVDLPDTSTVTIRDGST